MSVVPMDNLPDHPLDLSALDSHDYYLHAEKTVFFGHYWLEGAPSPFRHNVCCLDYSVAKGGQLVAYRFDGEEKTEIHRMIT
jgi:hypothetical protein